MSSNGSLQHCFELCEGNNVIAVNVVLLENLVNFSLAKVDAQFGEGIGEISSRDLLLVIDIELLEERLHSLLGQVLVDWNCGGNELVIVDKTILVVVALLDDLFNLVRIQIDGGVFDSVSQLVNLNGSTKIGIN